MIEGKGYSAWRRGKGFTSLELIIVILVLSVLSASIIIKNPFSISDYSSIAASQLIADIQYVQMRAMGTRSPQDIAFGVNASDYGIYSVAGVQKKLPGNVTITNTSFTSPLTFNSIGEKKPYTDGTIDLSGGRTAGGQTITIYASTGRAEIEH